MKFINDLISRYRWSFLGAVEGVTIMVKEDGTPSAGGVARCYWNLYERGDGKRRYQLIGINLGSPISNKRESEVKAWKYGGPTPTFATVSVPASKPPKPKANLIAFPGGKDGAA